MALVAARVRACVLCDVGGWVGGKFWRAVRGCACVCSRACVCKSLHVWVACVCPERAPGWGDRWCVCVP